MILKYFFLFSLFFSAHIFNLLCRLVDPPLNLTSRKEIFISKIVCDSDLQSLPVVVIIIGDTFTTYPRPPLPYSQNSVSSQKQACHQRTENFVQVAKSGELEFFFCFEKRTLTDSVCHIPDTESHGEIFAGPLKLDY
jgi:hypothetical protein